MFQISYVDIFPCQSMVLCRTGKVVEYFYKYFGSWGEKVIETKAKVSMISCVFMCLLSLLISFAWLLLTPHPKMASQMAGSQEEGFNIIGNSHLEKLKGEEIGWNICKADEFEFGLRVKQAVMIGASLVKRWWGNFRNWIKAQLWLKFGANFIRQICYLKLGCLFSALGHVRVGWGWVLKPLKEGLVLEKTHCPIAISI